LIVFRSPKSEVSSLPILQEPTTHFFSEPLKLVHILACHASSLGPFVLKCGVGLPSAVGKTFPVSL
jgi:hypothetical protein